MKFKKIFLIIIPSLLIIIYTALGSLAAPAHGGFSWYCKRTKDHTQPPIGSDISFVTEHGGYYIDKKCSDKSEEKVIYLTFDAGYENGNVAKILDTLKSENVTAAFFVLGHLIEDNTELVRRMQDEGHLVCNHTYTHKCTVGMSQEAFESELSRLEKSCLEKTGRELSKYYRPPEGRFDRQTLDWARELGYKTVFWSFAYADWDNNKQMHPETAKKKILDNIHNGAVLLLHPTSATNAAVLGDVIVQLRSQGYRFGSLDELCSE